MPEVKQLAGSEDPKPAIEEECGQSHHCASLKEAFEACQARLAANPSEETCVEELFDFMECVNHCAAPKLWAKLA
ncbi:ubiquinol-cytochrome C reductase hinge domain-containing protein [Polychytrium aggregatum]|uniref:ubiquinol-cytochrome C reductase hinge domain-containing protein n=1 Tax=Polychytrium aggregatum TaxID=110093 RepID=UPI0022FE9998|nr:ubiquinol-cytochrome C reductase hinge domain-containing protein [Polychytrium aggregatum]KAI9208799.1 ubiquinol-cytochrome C reductase hinge domain-containing protein [Polychytrium aggregatum]